MNNSALVLYRKILKVHKVMPKYLKELGDKYVQQEFRSHLYPKIENYKYTHYETFLKSWEKYLKEMEKPEIRLYGKPLAPEELASMSADQKKTLNSFKEGRTMKRK